MKESHWRAMSLVTTTTLIIVVASWASAQSRGKAETAAGDPNAATVGSADGRVIIERDRTRYRIEIGYKNNNENDKYILYDSWNLVDTQDIWFLKDPHKVRSVWKRIPFEKE
jgi:hypothetical protein